MTLTLTLPVPVRLPIAAVLLAAAAVAPTAAQSWPAKGITVVSPFAPGGANDLIARTMSARLAEALGVPVTVENRGGAGATVGTAHVARAAPDGYTLLVAGQSSLAFAPHLYSKLPYDSLRDFAPIMNVALGPYALTVNASVPAKSVADLLKIARSKKQALTFATSGAGSVSHLTMETLATTAGIDIVHVAYKGGAQAITDLVGGHVDLMFDVLPASLPYVKSGRLRALAITSAQRSTLVPDLPTVAESGLEGFLAITWNGILLPSNTPRDIVMRLHQSLQHAVLGPGAKERYAAIGTDAVMNTPEEFADFIRTETAKWAKVAAAAGIKPE